jgi:ABC-type phosphate transport system substrate-binding protein
MKSSNLKWLLALVAGIGYWSMRPPIPGQAQGSDALVMVVNRGNTSAAGMNLAEARKILLGDMSGWRDGSKVMVVLGPVGSSERGAVLKKVCGMSEAAYTRYEMQAAFTGQTAAVVREAASDAAIKSAVRANPGAVGFLHKSQIDDSVVVAMVLD